MTGFDAGWTRPYGAVWDHYYLINNLFPVCRRQLERTNLHKTQPKPQLPCPDCRTVRAKVGAAA